MNIVETTCVTTEKPVDKERDSFIMMINFDNIDWYTETEDIFKGEATTFVKFGVGCAYFLTTMQIQDFEQHLKGT